MNFLLVQSDQQRRDSLPDYDNDIVRAPNIESLARGGIVFDNTFTPCPLCAPARASLITGKIPVHHGILHNRESGTVAGRDFSGEHSMLADMLNSAGYASTLCGKWHVGVDLKPSDCGFDGVFYPGYGYPSRHPHYLEYLRREFDMDFTWKNSIHPRGVNDDMFLLGAVFDGPPEAGIPHYLVSQAIKAMEGAVEAGRPFFVRVDFWGPHAPYIIPEPYASMYDPADMPAWSNFADGLEGKPAVQKWMKHYWGVEEFTWDDWAKLAALCYGYVTYIDDEVGRLMETLERLSVENDTAVIYTSDHGGMVGAHGLTDKGPHMYDEEMRVPMVINAPGIEGGRRSDAYVYNMDLMPTLLELAGLDVPEGLDAASLAPILRGEKETVRPPVVFGEFHGHQVPFCQRMARIPQTKYIFNASDTDELYDLEKDPGELVNRIDDPACSETRVKMRGLLYDYLKRTGDPIRLYYESTRMR